MLDNLLHMDSYASMGVIKYARRVINIWEPSLAYVLNIALTSDGLKIVEINNINAAGFYDADVCNIIKALNALNKE